MMKKLAGILVAGGLALGCNSGGVRGLAKQYADETCACKTRECLEDAMKKHGERMSKLTAAEVKPDNMKQIEDMAADMKRAAECVQRIGMETQPGG